MRKFVAIILSCLFLAGSVPASAQSYEHDHEHEHDIEPILEQNDIVNTDNTFADQDGQTIILPITGEHAGIAAQLSMVRIMVAEITAQHVDDRSRGARQQEVRRFRECIPRGIPPYDVGIDANGCRHVSLTA